MDSWFIEKLMREIIGDYKIPKKHFEDELSPILAIFIEDLINSNAVFNEEINRGGLFKMFNKEFPFRINEQGYQSKNVDFLLLNDECVLMVELKTSTKFYKEDQKNKYLDIKRRIEKESGAFLIDDIHKILQKSSEKQKYRDTYEFLTHKDRLNQEKVRFKKINKSEIVYIGPETLDSDFGTDEPIILISFSELSKVSLEKSTSGDEKAKAWEAIKGYLCKIEKLDSLYY